MGRRLPEAHMHHALARLLLVVSFVPAACTTPKPGSGDTDSPRDTAEDDDTSDETGSPTDTGDTAADTGEPEPWPELHQAGPYPVDAATDWINPSGICFTNSTTYTPRGAPVAAHVVLAHGFSRYEGVLAEVATHWASWGLTVRTMTLCHIYVLDNDPDQDAADLVGLSEDLGGGPVIYAGHSAGGMRAVLAGAADPDTVAVLGLDLVDAADGWGGGYLGETAAADLAVPLGGVHGESSDCNDQDGGLRVYTAAPRGDVLRATEADHCDFEAPTDSLCTMVCQGENRTFTDAEIGTTIRSLTTAFLLWQAGIEPRGEAWWTPGEEPYDTLLSAGAIGVP